MSYLLGYDIGSSSIKATLIDSETGAVIATATSPKTELEIKALQPGWAEQDPQVWWDNIKAATAMIKVKTKVNLHDVQAIGLSYQMHGLVLVDQNHRVLRPAIIWCDSRAVKIGEKAFAAIGPEKCLKNLLNSPGNFTASKLRWVQENEPKVYSRVYKAMLPGDYVALLMTGMIKTTPSGLSEGIMWDFLGESPARFLLDYYEISPDLLPELAPTFSVTGYVTNQAANELGLKPGIPLAYRAGDQPNNAFSLNVLNPGEVAATAGTSGVVYGVGELPNFDLKSRVNTFVHVNHQSAASRYGILLCLNGAGILNRWLKLNVAGSDKEGLSYDQMNELAKKAPVGAKGLVVLPYGNGAERTLENRNIGALMQGLDFNIHDRSHILRAAQEGIVFALNYGLEIMREMGVNTTIIRAGQANMFLSPLFCEAFSTVTGARVELYNTDGSQGAARGAGVGAKVYPNYQAAFAGLKTVKVIQPNQTARAAYLDAYNNWLSVLKKFEDSH
ncbi:MAG TPA: FGGY family carbohydrate kinase [Bacillota bacterium]|nr:FGGY family carbohydrate kinase [Bacillota bacterium]